MHEARVRHGRSGLSFASVLDRLAETDPGETDDHLLGSGPADAEPPASPLDDETWALLAARIALTMAPPPEKHTRIKLHRRFFDADLGDEPDDRLTEELPALPPGLTRSDLERLRRLFARVNHPDRVPPAEREAANRRMATFNRMIDDALRLARHMPGNGSSRSAGGRST